MHKRLVTLPSWQAAEHRVRPASSNLEWALAHRHAFIVGGGNDPALGLKYVHKRVVPALLNDSSLWSNRVCHVVDVGAASYGPATGYDYSDSLLFLGSLAGSAQSTRSISRPASCKSYATLLAVAPRCARITSHSAIMMATRLYARQNTAQINASTRGRLLTTRAWLGVAASCAR